MLVRMVGGGESGRPDPGLQEQQVPNTRGVEVILPMGHACRSSASGAATSMRGTQEGGRWMHPRQRTAQATHDDTTNTPLLTTTRVRTDRVQYGVSNYLVNTHLFFLHDNIYMLNTNCKLYI